METSTAINHQTVLTVVGKVYDRFGFSENTEFVNEVVAILDDPSFSVVDEDANNASLAARKIRDRLWTNYSGGTTSAAVTCDLFYSLGRENELGWIVAESPQYKFRGTVAR